MKALTVHQPYAELIASGAKWIENRTWPTPHRGELAIHAGVSKDWLDHRSDAQRFVFGAVVAVATLVDCLRLSDLSETQRQHEHANGPWCWILENVRRVPEPIPYRGAQGLWTFPVDPFIGRAAAWKQIHDLAVGQ